MTPSPKRAVAQESLRGTLRIERESRASGPHFEVSFRHNGAGEGPQLQSVVVAGSDALVELLDHLQVDFGHPEVKQAIEDLLRFGDGFLPDMAFSPIELSEAGFNQGPLLS